MSIRSRGDAGFSLIEVMIAFGIIVVIVFVTIITQTGSSNSSMRNAAVIRATLLARNLINEQELRFEGVDLEKLPKTDSKNFTEPDDKFKWTITYDKVDFGPLTDLLARESAAAAEKSGGSNATTETLLHVFKEYLGKSVRRMIVTIEWPDGTGTSSQTFTQLLVNYDAEFQLTF
jgi:type II secretory pathway pseudopilin PulG